MGSQVTHLDGSVCAQRVQLGRKGDDSEPSFWRVSLVSAPYLGEPWFPPPSVLTSHSCVLDFREFSVAAYRHFMRMALC